MRRHPRISWLVIVALVLTVPVAGAAAMVTAGEYKGTGAKKGAAFDFFVGGDSGHIWIDVPTRCRIDDGTVFNGGFSFDLILHISPAGAISGSWRKVKRTRQGTYRGQVIRQSVQIKGAFTGSVVKLQAKASYVQTFHKLFQKCYSPGWVRMHGTLQR